MPLEFDRTAQVLVWNNGSLTYSMKSQAVFVDTGVKPIGSTWARNPIPRVNDNNLGLANPETCPGPGGDSGPGCLQFRPPCPWDHGLIPCHEPHENEPHTGSSQEPVCKQYINLFTVSAKAEIANLMAIPKSSIHFTWLSFLKLFLICIFYFGSFFFFFLCCCSHYNNCIIFGSQ